MTTDCDRGYDSSAEIHRELAKVACQQLGRQKSHRWSPLLWLLSQPNHGLSALRY